MNTLLWIYQTCPRYRPHNTILAGDSAGGGLCAALLLALKQRGQDHDRGSPLLPKCVSLISPFVDLTFKASDYDQALRREDQSSRDELGKSAPSARRGGDFLVPEVCEVCSRQYIGASVSVSDLRRAASFRAGGSSSEDFSAFSANSSTASMKNDAREAQIQKDLRNPFVSPLYGDLSNLPPILVQVGGSEVLREQGMRFCLRARSYGTSVQLMVYEDMPHVFPMFASFVSIAREAINHQVDFFAQILFDSPGDLASPRDSVDLSRSQSTPQLVYLCDQHLQGLSVAG